MASSAGQNWSFRFTLHPREGLVLHTVSWDDHGRARPVLYRASLSEMVVPYGDPDGNWVWRNAFDEGRIRPSAGLRLRWVI